MAWYDTVAAREEGALLMARTKAPKAFYVREDPAGTLTRFETFEEARHFADKVAAKRSPYGAPDLCWVVVRTPQARKRVLYRALPSEFRAGPGGGDGASGVREPRRPRPTSSSGAAALAEPAD